MPARFTSSRGHMLGWLLTCCCPVMHCRMLSVSTSRPPPSASSSSRSVWVLPANKCTCSQEPAQQQPLSIEWLAGHTKTHMSVPVWCLLKLQLRGSCDARKLQLRASSSCRHQKESIKVPARSADSAGASPCPHLCLDPCCLKGIIQQQAAGHRHRLVCGAMQQQRGRHELRHAGGRVTRCMQR